MTERFLWRRAAIGATIAAVIGATPTAGSTSSAPPSTEPAVDTAFPGEEWQIATPAEVGLDPIVLDEVAFGAGAADSNCLVVVRHGRIAAEWYWNGTDAASAQEVFSVSKSVTSALVGVAQADGALDVTDPASAYVPEWQGTDSAAVSIENLLSNDSGREWSPGQDYGEMAVDAADSWVCSRRAATLPGSGCCTSTRATGTVPR